MHLQLRPAAEISAEKVMQIRQRNASHAIAEQLPACVTIILSHLASHRVVQFNYMRKRNSECIPASAAENR